MFFHSFKHFSLDFVCFFSSWIINRFSSVFIFFFKFSNYKRTNVISLSRYMYIFKFRFILGFFFSCWTHGCPRLFLPTSHQSLESALRHPGDNRTQIRELGQTLIDGGILDELISEKLEAFNSRYEQLNHQVRTSSS